MTVKEHNKGMDQHLTVEQQAMVIAMTLISERLRRLDKDDFDTVFQMIGDLGPDSQEDRQAALEAIMEILDQQPLQRKRMALEPKEPAPKKLTIWIEYVSNLVRTERMKAALTQEDLAERSGLPQSHISRIENGVHSPSRATLEKIAKALNLPVSHFDPNAGWDGG